MSRERDNLYDCIEYCFKVVKNIFANVTNVQRIIEKHEDVTILDMSVSKGFNSDDVQGRIEAAEKSAGNTPDYIISDNDHNLFKGITGSRHIRHADTSHSMGVILRNVYEKQSDFVEFTTLLGKKRLQYHLTDKAYLLPPNMRAISRFMNMSSWVFWGNEMLDCYGMLPEKNSYPSTPLLTSFGVSPYVLRKAW